jgi:SlyX protein
MQTLEQVELRLAEIEIKLGYSEDLVESLNHTVYRQQQQIDQLQMEIRAMREEKRNEENRVRTRDLREEIPPHY